MKNNNTMKNNFIYQIQASPAANKMAEEDKEEIYNRVNKKIRTSRQKIYWIKVASIAASLIIGISIFSAHLITRHKQDTNIFQTIFLSKTNKVFTFN